KHKCICYPASSSSAGVVLAGTFANDACFSSGVRFSEFVDGFVVEGKSVCFTEVTELDGGIFEIVGTGKCVIFLDTRGFEGSLVVNVARNAVESFGIQNFPM